MSFNTNFAPRADTSLAPNTSRPLILIADDYEENRRLLLYYLRDLYNAVQAATGEEAVRLYQERQPALVLMDLSFGEGMNGIDAATAIKAAGGTAPIVALTAYNQEEERQRCKEAGFADFLAKPVPKQKLRDTIARLLGTAKPKEEKPEPAMFVSRRRRA
jgi:CheY-like chemotaxis protein